MKRYSDTTLLSFTKTELIELLRCAEHNQMAAEQMLEQHIENVKNFEPAVHGRWIGQPLCGNDNCRCSECGSWFNVHVSLSGKVTQKYCPNCGAKMDEDVNNAND